MDNNYVSVSQVNSYIKSMFDKEYNLKGICVFGEVSSYNISNGIAYFNIKDDDNLLSCVLFGALKFDKPQLGDMVLVTGSMSFYGKGGRLSFNATKIMPYGKGLLYENFLKLKADLESKGYFDPTKKQSLPKYVKRIGVVSSSTGAVIQDIIDVTTRRNDGVDIVLYPVKVQGVGAENEIARGIEFFNTAKNVDVIIVARGGGSLEDLQPFNTEIVANATFNSKLPLVSAVGHETDYTIIDFVSDLRAPTPSAAAELVVWDKQNEKLNIYNIFNKIDKQINSSINKNINIVSEQFSKIIYHISNNNQKFSTQLFNYEQKIFNLIDNKINNIENNVNIYSTTINNLNPVNVMNRGYIKASIDGQAFTTIDKVKVDQDIKLELIDGTISANIRQIKGN